MTVIAGVLAALAVAIGLVAGRTAEQEVRRLLQLLAVRDGTHMAEIGAGTGWLTVEVAGYLGDTGRLYSTELSQRRLSRLREVVADAGLGNVVVTEAGEHTANLPAGCCEAVFMRRVYHHFENPPMILRDLHHALLEGGRLVIVEFEPAGLLGTVARMGIDRARLTAEVNANGFELVRIDDWPGWGHYVAVFVKSGQ